MSESFNYGKYYGFFFDCFDKALEDCEKRNGSEKSDGLDGDCLKSNDHDCLNGKKSNRHEDYSDSDDFDDDEFDELLEEPGIMDEDNNLTLLKSVSSGDICIEESSEADGEVNMNSDMFNKEGGKE